MFSYETLQDHTQEQPIYGSIVKNTTLVEGPSSNPTSGHLQLAKASPSIALPFIYPHLNTSTYTKLKIKTNSLKRNKQLVLRLKNGVGKGLLISLPLMLVTLLHCIDLIHFLVIKEEGTATEKMPTSYWPVSKPMRHFLISD